jgi:hypothetical protein
MISISDKLVIWEDSDSENREDFTKDTSYYDSGKDPEIFSETLNNLKKDIEKLSARQRRIFCRALIEVLGLRELM